MRQGSRPTIRDVAEAAGVSLTTVSYVLSGRPGGTSRISRPTQDRVQAAARELGYVPNSRPAGCGADGQTSLPLPSRTSNIPGTGPSPRRRQDPAAGTATSRSSSSAIAGASSCSPAGPTASSSAPCRRTAAQTISRPWLSLPAAAWPSWSSRTAGAGRFRCTVAGRRRDRRSSPNRRSCGCCRLRLRARLAPVLGVLQRAPCQPGGDDRARDVVPQREHGGRQCGERGEVCGGQSGG